MQDTQSDPDNCRRLGTDEQYINFRPSPNFKNMKKFLKCKIDYSESSSQSPPNGCSEQTTPNNDSPPATQQPIEKSPVKPIVHPPLPLEPPPPEDPPMFPVPIKHEVIDTEYQDQENGNESPDLSTAETENTSSRLSLDSKTEELEGTSIETKKVTICRDFIRGTCSRRAGTCRFAHQRDLSQLTGVYTFCRNFQNSVCTLPLCRYVHATVFEEQEFYRTGILPLHVQNHMKQKPIFMLPPPPPPPPPEVTPPEIPIANDQSPRQLNTPDKPLISCVPVSKLESKPAGNDFRHMLQAIRSPLKREWNALTPFSPPPRDLDNKDNLKKCKHCDTMDIRVQYNQEKTENMVNSITELEKKAVAIAKQNHILRQVLSAVIKMELSTEGGLQRLAAKMSMLGEKEREIMQHILMEKVHGL